MSKNKKNKKNNKNTTLLSDYIYNDIQSVNVRMTLDIVKNFIDMGDGSKLPESYEWEIINLFTQYPEIMKLICSAYWEK